jgi:hypothetical protein
MKLKTFAVSFGVALSSLSGQASAADCVAAPADPYTCTASPGYDNFFITGATAPDNFLETTVTSWLEPGYVKIIDSIDGRQQRAFVGKFKVTAPVPAAHQGKSVRIIKRSTGGSVFGVNPVARDEFLAVLDVKNTLGTCTTTGSPRVCPVLGVDGASGQKPTLGVSDVSPEMFKAPYNVEFDRQTGQPVLQLSASETAGLTIKAANVLSMGIVATNSVPASTVFTKAIYGDLLRQGGYADWSQVSGAITPAAGTGLVVCRRVPGSGTQTSYNWFFHNFPCTQGSVVGNDFNNPKRMADSFGYDPDGDGNRGLPGEDGTAKGAKAFTLDPTAGLTVIENSTSGNVRDCLEKAQNGGTHEFQDEEGKWVKVDFGTGGYGAIGVLSLDSLNNQNKSPAAPNACDATNGKTVCGWSFRALDGAGTYSDSDSGTSVVPVASAGATGFVPSKANLTSGNYQFAVELTFQYKTSKTTGSVKTLADDLITAIGAPSGNSSDWVAALPPQPLGANTAKGTHGGNMCKPLELFY